MSAMAHRALNPFAWLAVFSYLVALILNALPLSKENALLLPPFGLLVLFYWTQQDLRRTHFLAAVMLGLLYDAMTDTLLGLHALLFSILLFIFLRMRLRFRLAHPLQQAGVLMILLYLFQLMQLPLVYAHLHEQAWGRYFAMPLTTLIFWPLLKYLLDWLTHTPVHINE